jgi:hypothetical protein
LIDNCVTGPDDTPGHCNLYARFDDLHAAAASKDMFETALTTVTFEFVDHHEYFAFDYTHARAQRWPGGVYRHSQDHDGLQPPGRLCRSPRVLLDSSVTLALSRSLRPWASRLLASVLSTSP